MTKTFIKIAAGLAILIVLFVVLVILRHDNSPIPRSISTQANYVIFYPLKNPQIIIQKGSFKYDGSLKQVSFIVNFANHNITFAEQSSPDSFSDDANFYPQFIQSLNGYATFSSVDGTVDLTTPKETKNETAVMNSKGTLLFAQSTSGDLSENNWKELMNSLSFVQPNS